MLHSILQITGIEQKLEALRSRIEGQAQSLMQHGKAVAIQMAIATGLAVGAAILGLMALVAGLITLFFWLEPQVGSIAAMGIIAAGLLVIGIVLAVSAAMIGRKETPRVPAVVASPVATADIAAARMAEAKMDLSKHVPQGRDYLGLGEFQSARPVTAEEVESLFAVAGQFTRLPNTGIEQVDNMLRSLAPKAEEATREAVARAANLVRYGDRSTVLAILGTALAIGWAMTKVDQVSKAKAT
jgi:hypothetical protein